MDTPLSTQTNALHFQNSLPLDKLNSSLDLGPISSESPILSHMAFDQTVDLGHSCEEPYIMSGVGDWNVNYSKLCMYFSFPHYYMVKKK